MAGNKLSAKAARLDFSKLPGAVAAPSPSPSASSAVAGLAADAASAASPAAVARDVDARAPVGLAAGYKAKTAPGAMMAFANDARSELVRENEALRERAAQADSLRGQLGEALNDLAQWDGAKAARLLDARLVVPSAFANRHEASFSDPGFALLRQEIENAGGNVQPVKVRLLRPVRTAGQHAPGAALPSAPAGGNLGSPAVGSGAVLPQYELVFGHRRHRACLELGLPLLAVIDNLDDQALFVEMERENRVRKDLSAWEQGRMYRHALSQGLFPSNRKLAEAIGVDLSALGKALVLADLPDAVVAAFESPLALQFRWAKPLADAVARRPEATLAQARALARDRAGLSAKQVFERLTRGLGLGVEPFHPRVPDDGPGQARAWARPVVCAGKPVGAFSIDAQGGASVRLDSGVLTEQQLHGLFDCVQRFLDGKGS